MKCNIPDYFAPERNTMHDKQILRIGIGGPVGSGKTALVDSLCKRMRDQFQIGVVTNDIYTREDQQFLIRSQALAEERILGVETGGCPHTAIREDASMNLAAVDELCECDRCVCWRQNPAQGWAGHHPFRFIDHQ